MKYTDLDSEAPSLSRTPHSMMNGSHHKKSSPDGLLRCLLFTFSDTAVSVVGENTGGRIVDVAALPAFIRHPEILDHFRLSRVVFLENLAVQQAFLCKRPAVTVLRRAFLKLLICILCLGVGLQVIDHRVSDRIREGCLLPPQNVLRKNMVLLEGMSE